MNFAVPESINRHIWRQLEQQDVGVGLGCIFVLCH